jgi:hypothetical protein
MRIAVLIALVALLTFSTSVVAQPTPAATPADRIACDEISGHHEDVYLSARPPITFTEYAIVSAAWNGADAWRNMSTTDLYLAATFYREWARNLRSASDPQIPEGLDEYHSEG